jgi:hypothetical protein
MIDSFSDIVSKMKYHLVHKNEGYAFPMMPKYNKVVGNILPGQYTVISGMQSSGKTSFVDENYVLGVLLQWKQLQVQPPLKIFYFSLKDTSLKKFQSLLCAYIKLVHNKRIDIPTLNSQPGRLFNIENEPIILKTIDDAQVFFDEVIEDGILQVVTNVSQPSAMHALVNEYLLTQPEYEGEGLPLTLVVVDSTDHLASESNGYRIVSGAELDYSFDSYMSLLVKERNVHAVIVTPADKANSKFPKENEPNYRQLGIYGKNADKGIVLYNPIAENNGNYLRGIEDPAYYLSPSGLNLLRFWHIVKNVDGVDSESERLLFVPGTGYMIEASMMEKIDSFNQVYDRIYNVGLNPFYKHPPEDDEPTTDTSVPVADVVEPE